VWTVENGKLVKRGVVLGRKDDAAGRIEVRTELPAVPVLAARFDNLKDGAPAIVKALSPSAPASAPAAAPAAAPTSGTTASAG
jgi:hypothetical protein